MKGSRPSPIYGIPQQYDPPLTGPECVTGTDHMVSLLDVYSLRLDWEL